MTNPNEKIHDGSMWVFLTLLVIVALTISNMVLYSRLQAKSNIDPYATTVFVLNEQEFKKIKALDEAANTTKYEACTAKDLLGIPCNAKLVERENG